MTAPEQHSRAPRGDGPARRVLYVPVLFYPEPWNGIMEHLSVLIGGLDRARFEPLVGTRPDDGDQTTSLVERTGVGPVELGAARTVHRLWNVFRAVRPDIVHVHTPSTSGLARLALAARLARVPKLVVTLHQVAPEPLAWRSRLVNRAGHALIDTTIAVSAGAADTQAAHAGLARHRIRVVHNGVEDVRRASPPSGLLPRLDGEVWAGYFGRLAAEKGVDTLIDAVAQARREGASLRLVVAGEGYERQALEARAGLVGCAEAVLFTGHRTDARTLMEEVDIVVHPPRFEGFGLVVAEAMAAARPVIASDVPGGIPEMVQHGHTGMLVPYGDVGALASALRRLVRDEALRSRFGHAGRSRFLEQFTVPRMIEQTIAAY